MKKILISLILSAVLYTNNIHAQYITQQQRDSILNDLYAEQWTITSRAIKSIEYFKIYEAIPILESIIWNKDVESRFSFVQALFRLNAENTNEYAIALFDTLNIMEYPDIDSIEMKLQLLSILLNLGDFSKINYLYYNTESPQGKSHNWLTIDIWNYLLNIPEYEQLAKEKLIALMKESINGSDRAKALFWLGDKYKEQISSIILSRFLEENDFTIKWEIINKYFPWGDSKIVSNIAREGLLTESNQSIQRQIIKYLLDSLNTPSNYSFVTEWLNEQSGDLKFKKSMKIYDRYISIGKPYKPDSLTSIIEIIDSTYSYLIQSEKYLWIGDSNFSEGLKTALSSAKANLNIGDSLACAKNIKSFQDTIDYVFKDSLNTNPSFVTLNGWKFLYWNAQYILDRLPQTSSETGFIIRLTSSIGALLTGGSLQYYEGSWRDAVNNGDGTFKIITEQPSVSLRMTYEHGTQTASNIPAQNNTYTFQTVNTRVQLKNSQGAIIDQGTVQYYAGAWKEFDSTTNGVAAKELLPNTYSFRMTYAYGSNDKQQNIGADPVIVFQTVNAAVQLQNSQGVLMDQGTIQYYAGAWRDFGTTTNGTVSKELLPNNYSFRMTYAYGSNDKQQNIGANLTVIFQTVNATVQLQNSQGALIDQGTVQYYAGAWRQFGITSNGTATKELLSNNYSFRMTYEYISNDKQQNIGTNPTIIFPTTLTTIRVNNAQGQPVDNASVKYYAGAWRTIGNTVNGEVTKELLPANIAFRVNAGTDQQDKTQNTSTNPIVEFNLP